jgi:hypothetical protein
MLICVFVIFFPTPLWSLIFYQPHKMGMIAQIALHTLEFAC